MAANEGSETPLPEGNHGSNKLSNQQRMLTEAADKLTDQLTSLNASVKTATDLRDELRDLTKTAKTNRKLIIALAFSFALDLALTAALTFGLMGLNTNSNRLDDLTATLNADLTVQRVEALCPLYQLFVAADTPQAREAARLRGDDLTARDKAFETIRKSYEALRCQAFIGGK